MVLTGLRKNLVVKEILNTGIIHSMQKVLEVILEDQQYLEMARILTAEVNLFLYQTENNSYPHLHRHYTLTYQKRSEEHTSELQSRFDLVCRLLLEKKKKTTNKRQTSNKQQE